MLMSSGFGIRQRSRLGFLSILFSAAVIQSLVGCSPADSTDADGDVGGNMNDGGDAGQAITVTFEGDGGATPPNTTDFSYRGASFTGGRVRTVGDTSLYVPGSLFSYEVLEGATVTITFDKPVDLLELFFVTGGTGRTVLTAFDADGGTVGAVTAAQPGSGNEVQSVNLSANATRVEVVHTGEGEGWLDDFTFRFAGAGGA